MAIAAEKAVLTLRQRLNALQGEIKGIKATGKTAQGQRTLSIADVEGALDELFAKHGIVTPYSFNEDPIIHWPETKMPLWQVDITIRLESADDGNDAIQARLIDVGGSPSAAVSYALKRFYRGLLHLADEQDEKREVQRGERVTQSAPVNPATGELSDDARVCPKCGSPRFKVKPDGTGFCPRADGGCGFPPPGQTAKAITYGEWKERVDNEHPDPEDKPNGHKEFRRPEAPVVGPDASEDWFAGLSAEPPKKGHGR